MAAKLATAPNIQTAPRTGRFWAVGPLVVVKMRSFAPAGRRLEIDGT